MLRQAQPIWVVQEKAIWPLKTGEVSQKVPIQPYFPSGGQKNPKPDINTTLFIKIEIFI